MEAATGRQLSRFYRFVRADPPSTAPETLPEVALDGEANGTNGGRGSVNLLSTALPLPDVIQELQQWITSLGLNPGPQDNAGFSERGNFRCGCCVEGVINLQVCCVCCVIVWEVLGRTMSKFCLPWPACVLFLKCGCEKLRESTDRGGNSRYWMLFECQIEMVRMQHSMRCRRWACVSLAQVRRVASPFRPKML